MTDNALDYKNYKKEMIDGKVYLMSPATWGHSTVVQNLNFIFNSYLKEKHKECIAFSEGLAVYLNKDDKTFVLPDVVIICDKSKKSKRGYEGVPSLVIEVLSPATMEYDKTKKFKKYEKSGVLEYWLVDYNNKSIEQFILIDEKYELFKTVVLLEEWEIDNLPEYSKQNYTKIIKLNVFKDLEINLDHIFDYE